MGQEFSVIGKRIPRNEAIACARGDTRYTVDLDFPGMLHAKILRSPHPHAKIRRIDTSEAENLPGVEAVITHKDVPRIPYTTAAHPHPDITPLDQYILDEKVRFVGDGVAAVAARSEEIAIKALDLIEVEYDELAAVFDPIEAMGPEAPQIHEAEHNVIAKGKIEVGDIEQGFAQADLVVTDRYAVQIVQHCNLEAHAAVSIFDRASGRLTVYSSTQVPFTLRRLLGRAVNMPASRIRVIKPPVGGGFGGKQEMIVEPICATLAMKTGRPVRLELTRAEEFYASRTRHAAVLEMKSGVKKDGTFTARQMKMYTNSGAYGSHGPIITEYGAVMWAALYRAPNLRYDGNTVYTNGPVGGAFRGYGVPQVLFALESHVDNLATKLRMDPLEFRLKNHIRAGDSDPVTGLVVEACGLEDCIRNGAEKIGWRRRGEERNNVGPKRRGIGMAALTFLSGAVPFCEELSAAVAKLNEDGTITLSLGAAEAGQGMHTAMAQIAAEELGIHPEDVVIVAGDTDTTPYDNGMFATRQTYVTGMAVKGAANEVREQLLRKAAELLEANPQDLNIRDRRVSIKGSPDRAVSLSEVAMASLYNAADGQQIMASYSHNAKRNGPPFGAQFAEVEVDVETGQVEVKRFVAAHDVGRVINPMIVEGQIEGGTVQGLGYALTEELLLDKNTGVALNPDFLNYKLLTTLDVPQIDTLMVESNDPGGPFGAKGIGEPPVLVTAPAIANAVYDAVGVRITELPITPEKVLAALKRESLS